MWIAAGIITLVSVGLIAAGALVTNRRIPKHEPNPGAWLAKKQADGIELGCFGIALLPAALLLTLAWIMMGR